MVDNYVLPTIREYEDVSPIPMRQLKIAGQAESKVDAAIAGIYTEFKDIETTILSSPGIISLYFTWKGPHNSKLADSQLEDLSKRIRQKMGTSVYSDQEKSIEEVLGIMLKEQNLTLATAESCTGGLIGKLLTDIPGSSSYYLGGIISYGNEVKTGILGVQPLSISKYGAVSHEVASQMALGVRKLMQSDIGVSITGIAGPEGGSKEKPVGTLYIGLSLSNRISKKGDGFSENGTKVEKFLLPGNREAIRLRSSRIALDWIRRVVI
jgi:nicotinamide-nucleotide amidase